MGVLIRFLGRLDDKKWPKKWADWQTATGFRQYSNNKQD